MAVSGKSIGRAVGAIFGGYLTSVVLTMGMHWVIAYSSPGAFDPMDGTMPPLSIQVLIYVLSFPIAIGGGWVAGLIAGNREVAHALVLGALMALLGFVMAFVGEPQMRMYMMILAIIALPGVTLGGYICVRWRAGRKARAAV